MMLGDVKEWRSPEWAFRCVLYEVMVGYEATLVNPNIFASNA